MYDNDVPLTIVDVEDVAQAIFNAATTKGLHGKDYLLTSETYRISDVNLMLNNLAPKEEGMIIYQNKLAKDELGIEFRPVRQTLAAYSYGL